MLNSEKVRYSFLPILRLAGGLKDYQRSALKPVFAEYFKIHDDGGSNTDMFRYGEAIKHAGECMMRNAKSYGKPNETVRSGEEVDCAKGFLLEAKLMAEPRKRETFVEKTPEDEKKEQEELDKLQTEIDSKPKESKPTPRKRKPRKPSKK